MDQVGRVPRAPPRTISLIYAITVDTRLATRSVTGVGRPGAFAGRRDSRESAIVPRIPRCAAYQNRLALVHQRNASRNRLKAVASVRSKRSGVTAIPPALTIAVSLSSGLSRGPRLNCSQK